MLILLNICLVMISITGCWNNKDVTEINIAAAVGIDKSDDHKIELTVQLVKPDAMKLGEGGGGGKEKAVEVFSITGDTVFECFRNLLIIVNQKIFISHLQLIVIGEQMARDGLSDIMDFFARDHEANRQAGVIIAKGTSAKEILTAESTLEKIPALHILSVLKNNASFAKTQKLMMIDVLKEISSPGKNLTIGVIEGAKEKEKPSLKDMKIEGSAAFKNDKLIGWLNSQETRGLLFTGDQVKSGIINIPNPLNEDKKVAIEMIRSSGKKDVKIKDEKLVFLIEIKEEGNIGDQQGNGDLTTPELIQKLEEEVAGAIEKDIRDIVDLAQKEYQSDIFGFGEIVYRKHLNYWQQVQENWDEEFSSTPVEIKVTAKIRRAGLIKKSILPK
ncbi:Ger(x)C family spore germination protein [Desulfitibacter alkalitolerans]|uniref:Ger(x)C family spore germination protein n=1 Tax=Desulfitibacter alkalitolerans TaxID=264641 RepID=UPI0004847B12|nr:Ger(x)C family spore germination protein [Desulfitibacter alkalitolerans]